MASSPIRRPAMRCKTCGSWWTGAPLRAGDNYPDAGTRLDPESTDRCGCGGELEAVDMDEHLAALPYVPMKPPGSA